MDHRMANTSTAFEEPEPRYQLVDEHAVARALGKSVSWVRKDRRGKRIIPFIPLGGSIRYDLERIFAVLAGMEEGGPASPRPRASRRKAP
jgi:hypothetical protein